MTVAETIDSMLGTTPGSVVRTRNNAPDDERSTAENGEIASWNVQLS
jgi:hypothetical protein